MATSTVHVMHCSMEFSDSTRQKQADANRIFTRAEARNVSWITGTEAGMGKSADLREALNKEAKEHGYRFSVKNDTWIAVDKALVTRGSWEEGFIATLPSSTGSQRFTTRGICWVEFDNTILGTISVGCSHYMTNGRKPGDEYYAANTKLTRAIGEWGKVHGAGKKICFYGADANIVDRTDDVFRGQPFTTLADELKDWQNSGHGSIDIIASYDADKRVKGKYFRVLDDKEFPLHTDHFACEGGFEVTTRAPVKAAATKS
jgi:hypothetical protein